MPPAVKPSVQDHGDLIERADRVRGRQANGTSRHVTAPEAPSGFVLAHQCALAKHLVLEIHAAGIRTPVSDRGSSDHNPGADLLGREGCGKLRDVPSAV